MRCHEAGADWDSAEDEAAWCDLQRGIQALHLGSCTSVSSLNSASQCAPFHSTQVISLICTNHPGASQPQFFTAAEAADRPGGSGSAPAVAAEQAEKEGEGERPRKRQKKAAEPKGKGKAKAREAAGPGGKAEKKKLGKLEQEAVDRAAAQEAPAAPPQAGGPKATLIVCPLSVMSNWAAQIEEHCAGNLSGRLRGRSGGGGPSMTGEGG